MVQQSLFPIEDTNKNAPLAGEQTIKKNVNAIKSQTRKSSKLTNRFSIQAFPFQPFPDRAIIFPGDYVIGLDLGAYDYYLVKLLKGIIAYFKGKAVNRARLIDKPGGWLASSKCWYVEASIWPDVKKLLITANIEVKEIKPNV